MTVSEKKLLTSILILLTAVIGYSGFQLYRYNNQRPMIIKVYRYKGNKLISSEVYQNDFVKCDEAKAVR